MRRFLLLSMTLLCCTAAGAKGVRDFVSQQLEMYPQARLLDIYKSCFQDYMGAEHLVADRESAKAYLAEELRTTSDESLMAWYIEPCGPRGKHVRVSLKAIRDNLVTEDALLEAFIRSANTTKRPSVRSWQRRWHKIIGTIDKMNLSLPRYDEDRQFIDSLLIEGKYAISHSPEYRETYHPHYRIVERKIYERELKPLLESKDKHPY